MRNTHSVISINETKTRTKIFEKQKKYERITEKFNLKPIIQKHFRYFRIEIWFVFHERVLQKDNKKKHQMP